MTVILEDPPNGKTHRRSLSRPIWTSFGVTTATIFWRRLLIPSGPKIGRSEGFPARDIWFLGTLEQSSAKIPEFLGNRRRHRRRRRRRRLLEIQVDIQARKPL